MTIPHHTFLDTLLERANHAGEQETEYRAAAAKAIDALARERVFAYRRLNLLRDMAQDAAVASSADDAPAAAVLALCNALGWETLTPPRQTIVEHLAPLADAVAEAAREPPAEEAAPAATARGVTVLEALARFEDWYRAAHGQPFFALFDTYVPETPIVDV